MRLCCLILSFLLAACIGTAPKSPGQETEISIEVPEGTLAVYLTGNLQSLGPWRPDALEMSGTGQYRRAALTVPDEQAFEYKFTLGSWDREAIDANNIALSSFVREADEAGQAHHRISGFKDTPSYIASPEASGVLGKLTYWLDVPSARLEEKRHVTIWTPPGYDEGADKRYRVIYMSDGQNLFDPRIANTGTDWGVDEAMMRVAKATGTDPAVVVSTWSTARRGPEYSPWHGAPDYAAFLREELMPRINREYRTLTGPENTFHIGSSMGGLLSFYLVTYQSDLFSACGCLSSHFPLNEAISDQNFFGGNGRGKSEQPYIERDIEAGLRPPKGVRYWFDFGTMNLDAGYGPIHATMREWLEGNAFVSGRDFVVREYPNADHNEASWRARLDDVLTFLLAPETGQ